MTTTTEQKRRVASRVVVLDNEKDDAAAITSALRKCFDDMGLEVSVEFITKPNELPGKLEFHPDVVICDISLIGDKDVSGLDLIRNYKKKHPHICFAAMTHNLGLLAQYENFDIHPDFFLPKNQLLPNVDADFAKRVVTLILQFTRQNHAFKIGMSAKVEGELKRALGMSRFDRGTIESLVRQVFSNNFMPATHTEASTKGAVDVWDSFIDEVEIREFDKAESTSPVFLALPKAKGEPQEVAVVLKFCSADAFFCEIRNYSRFVKWMLPYAWRVDILGVGRVRNLGVIGYSLAFAGSATAQPLSYFMARGEKAPVDAFVGRVFNEREKVWYRSVDKSNASLATVLTQRYFTNGQNRNVNVNQALDRIEQSKSFENWHNTDATQNNRTLLRRRLDGIFARNWSPFQTCICHGDLHAGNVMITPEATGMVFIDFEDTGRHHVFTDFVFFENAVRKDGGYQWPPINQLLEVERTSVRTSLKGTAFVAGTGTDGETIIQSVRTRAFLNFADEPRAHYFVHALLFAVMMLNARDLDGGALERMSAFLISCVDSLHND